MMFMSRIECQFKALTVSSSNSGHFEAADLNKKFEENVDEFMKKKKKGKLSKKARQKFYDRWSRHHKWPYPSEIAKLAQGLVACLISGWKDSTFLGISTIDVVF
ncbi:hypothetical protein IFM89_015101 [Coptis chinensis]|uniref:Uncharacterized protein n=1 Tax=Coptis chinensis TaxID=261450 RepID=A0A835M6B2_9MAGN|nr:hypothetical protein IFM89_015101 [Coptis chinensis]